MGLIDRPWINNFSPQGFLKAQLYHIARGERICPNCGTHVSIHTLVFDGKDNPKLGMNWLREQPLKVFLGLCSKRCCQEFLGRGYHVFNQNWDNEAYMEGRLQ